MVLVAGGIGNGGYLSSAELYNPATGKWTLTGPLHTARALSIQRRCCPMVGCWSPVVPSTLSVFYPAPSFTIRPPGHGRSPAHFKPRAEQHAATLLTNGQVLVVGGSSTIEITGLTYITNEVYNPATGTWTATNSWGTPRTGHTATLLPNGNVLVAAGFDSGFLSGSMLCNPAAGKHGR